MMPKVAIIYLAYNSGRYIEEAAASIAKVDYPKNQIEFLIVENPHPQFGLSESLIHNKILTNTELPPTTYLPQKENLGFAGGINRGIQVAIEKGCTYVFLHNHDGVVDKNFLAPLVEAMEADPKIGAAQSLIMLKHDREHVNTAGNVLNFLGIGYLSSYKELKDSIPPGFYDIGYASGAAVLLRTDLLAASGLWNESFFMYHEDIEYSMRLKMLGYRVVCVSSSIFFHDYEFGHNAQKYYFHERNRLGLLLLLFKWPTLLLITPALLIWELGQIIFAIARGWWGDKVKSYRYWFAKDHWRTWLEARNKLQHERKVTDRQLFSQMSTVLIFSQASALEKMIINFIVNPVLILYGSLVKLLIFW